MDSLALFAKENNLKFSVKYVNMQNASGEHPGFNSADDSIGTSDPFFPDDPSDSADVGGSYSVVNATLLDGQQYPPLSLSYNDYSQNYFSASLSATFTYSSSGFIYAIYQTVVYHNVSCKTPSSFVVLSGITDHSPENIQNQQAAFSGMNCFERVDDVELYYFSSELQKQNIKWQCNFLLYYFVEDFQYDTI